MPAFSLFSMPLDEFEFLFFENRCFGCFFELIISDNVIKSSAMTDVIFLLY